MIGTVISAALGPEFPINDPENASGPCHCTSQTGATLHGPRHEYDLAMREQGGEPHARLLRPDKPVAVIRLGTTRTLTDLPALCDIVVMPAADAPLKAEAGT